MTTARGELVDPALTRYYHCISRCVRQAFLCGEGFKHHKQWIEDRLELLAANFSVAVAGFAVMDNHLQVLCRLDPELADAWSAEEVIRRWIVVYPPRTLALDDETVVNMWVKHEAKDKKRVETIRKRLHSLGWFMKALKEPLARLANREGDCKGTFWESRFKSVAILDEVALLATCVYIDLNPVAAGEAATPETSKHTSVRQRVAHVRNKGKLDCLKVARQGCVAGSRAAGNVEQDHWLVPIEDRRNHPNTRRRSDREGMFESFSFGSYLLLVDYTSRLFRGGKARCGDGVKEIFERLGTSEEFWSDRLTKMLSSRRLHGRFFAGNREAISELAHERGCRHLANLSPQPAG